MQFERESYKGLQTTEDGPLLLLIAMKLTFQRDDVNSRLGGKIFFQSV